MISAIVAVAILAISAFVLDQGYLLSAPAGSVEVNKVTPIQSLDEIVVSSKQ